MDSVPIPLPGHLPSHADIVLDHTHNHEDNDDGDETEEEHAADQLAPGLARPGTENASSEPGSKQSRPRGRKARDPNAEIVRFDCKDVDDLEIYLREYLEAPTANPEHATIEFHFPVTAAFMVYTRDFKRDPTTNWTSADVTDLMRKTAVSVYEVLQETQNPKDQIVRQKAVGRTIVEAVQRADKFKYSFHNNWLSREDQAHRFSFFCNDSTLNKGRAANGGVGSEGKISRKAVYDCKGLIAVKFSVTKQNLEVHYKHIPLHGTFDERAPLPRRESKRRRMLEVIDPDRLKNLVEERKRKRREEKMAAGWVPGRGGRLQRPGSELAVTSPQQRRRRSEGPQTNNIIEQAIADEGLQPLLDFLGSAERRSRNGDDNEDDVVMTDRDGHPLHHRGSDAQSTTPPAFPRAKMSELRSTIPRRRAKYHGPVLPGMMEGSLDSGSMNWTVTTPTTPPQSRLVQNIGSRSATDGRKRKRKQKERPEEDGGGGNKKQNQGEESELEQLKRRLYETEQRLMKIEAEKAAGTNVTPQTPQPSAYPPYPYYPYYPYPPPPQDPHYPAPPQIQPPSATIQTPSGAPRKHVWQEYQPSHKSATSVLQSQEREYQPRPDTLPPARNPEIPAQTSNARRWINHTSVLPASTVSSLPNQSTSTSGNHEPVPARDTVPERPQIEAAPRDKTLAGPHSSMNKTGPTPVTQPRSSVVADAPLAKPAAPSQPPTSSEAPSSVQTPSQSAAASLESASASLRLASATLGSVSASLGNNRPAPSPYIQHPSNASNTQATAQGAPPDSASQHHPQTADSTKTNSTKPSQPPARGGVRLNASRHVEYAASSEEIEDPYMKGLFDSAIAAIKRPEASTDPPCGPTVKTVKEPYGTLPATGASSFKLSNYKPTPKNFYRFGGSDTDNFQAQGNRTTGAPSGTTQNNGPSGTPIAPPYPPPYYHYPYPPHQQKYPPYPPGPPPPGYHPYPRQGFPPYPPPPGYGYHPYPPYSHPPAPPPQPAETEEQRKTREQKEKDDKEGAPAWATQLREAMQGYASGTPASASVEKGKATEARAEPVASSNTTQSVPGTDGRADKDVGQAKETEVVEIDSDDGEDDEFEDDGQDDGRERESRATGSESDSASFTSARDGMNARA